jgi:hypothetical protein
LKPVSWLGLKDIALGIKELSRIIPPLGLKIRVSSVISGKAPYMPRLRSPEGLGMSD